MGRPVQISLSGLHFAYDSAELFAGLNLEIPGRQTLAVVGASGTGKTSLLHLVAGILTPTAGSIVIGGVPDGRADRSASRRGGAPVPQATSPSRQSRPRLVVMFQQNALLPWFSVTKNVALGLRFGGATRHQARDRAGVALREVGLAGMGGRFPSQLSGGQRQRVALARTLVLEPEILLLDEPFAAVDTLTRESLQELVSATVVDRADLTVLVTHSVEEAAFLADRVVVLARPAHRDAAANQEDGRPAAIVADISFEDHAEVARSALFRRTDAYFERCRLIRANLEIAARPVER